MRALSLPVLIIFMATLFCGAGFPSSRSSSSQNSLIVKPATWNDGSAVIDHWFFVVPEDNKQKDFRKKAKELIVHNGEAFGIGVRFISKKAKVNMQIADLEATTRLR